MPDVSRSDSQRSDISARPRVSFNRDVHVKRIGTAGAPRVVGALAGDASGRLLPLAVRRERPTRLSRRDLAKEAQRVLEQADKVTCTGESVGLPVPVDKYSTLPPIRRKKARPVKPAQSLREKNPRVVRELVKEGNSSSSTERGSSVKRPRTSLARSVSDVAARDDTKTKFWSLDRLRSKKNKHNDVTTPVVLSKPEKTASRRFNGDSTQEPRKQLSPIIEASPREDYFEPKVPNRTRKSAPPVVIIPQDAMETSVLHSSQTISKPVLTRGRTVDTMVRKLSQDRAGRGPPRVVSPLKALAPGDDRQHNNNLPFSYTEPRLYTQDDSGYSMTGVNEKDKYVPTYGSPTMSDSVHGGAEPTQVIYAEVVCNGGGRPGKQTVHTSVQRSSNKAVDTPTNIDERSGHNNNNKAVETPTSGHTGVQRSGETSMSGHATNIHELYRSETRDFVAEGRGRADGMDSRRNVQEDESYRRVSPIRRNLMEDFINNSYDRIEPVLQKHLDLSSRRDRLESRIESQRKDRLLSSRSHQDVNVNDSRIIDNHRKYPSNPRLDGGCEYNNRREFLNSQLNQFYGDKKDQLTDSGIDINYHGSHQEAGGKVVSELRTYHNTYETTINTDVNVRVPKQKIKQTSRPTVTNVTKVDVNGHIKPEGSDDEDDVDVSPKYYYNQQENIDQIKKRSGLTSTKLVQESSKRGGDVVPPSAVLIRHYAPSPGDEWAEERRCDLGDAEETRRFLVEERRRSEGDHVDGGRPEKVVEKRAKKTGAMDKMRALFTRGGGEAKKKRASKQVADPVTARYVEYKGSSVELDRATPTTQRPVSRGAHRASSNHLHVQDGARSRRERLPTPSPSPSRPATLNRVNNRNVEADNNSGSWFKSLDRLRGKSKPKPKMDHPAVISENEHEEDKTFTKTQNNNNNVDKTNKNLRFFGDTDAESVRSHGNHHRAVKPMMSLPENPAATRYGEAGSTRYVPLRDGGNNRRYKSGSNKLQVPRRRHHRSAGELATSSAESTTEGDSSQQSQRSVVYLHAATVGDIPGRVPSRSARLARSREELSSTAGSNVQPATRTVSRSISVLAPWKPRHYREGLDVHYDNRGGGGGGKPPRVPPAPKSTSTLVRPPKSSHKSYNSLSRKDKENVKSLNSLSRDSTDSLSRDARRAQSIESLGKGRPRNVSTAELDKGGYRTAASTLKKGKVEGGKKRTELSRSVSMPKDSKVKSGWFRRKARS